MLLVKTKLKSSKIDGIGLFANEFIKKGTIIWKYHPLFEKIITTEEIEALEKTPKKNNTSLCLQIRRKQIHFVL